MQLSRMLEIFSTLNDGGKINITEEEISFLAGKEFLKPMPAGEYENIYNLNAERNKLNRGIDDLLTASMEIEARINELEIYFQTFTSKIAWKTSNEKKMTELKGLREELVSKKEALEKMKSRRDELGQSKTDISGYVPAGTGYVKVMEKGREKSRFIRSLSPRLKNASYEQMEKEVGIALENIRSRSLNLQESYNLIVQKYKFRESENTARFAMVLSKLKGDRDENMSRAHVVDDRIYGMDFPNPERMDAVSFMIMQEGNMDHLSDRLVEMFYLLCGDGYSRNYTTWKIAASMLKVPGEYALDKYKRFDMILNAMKERGWSKRSYESNLIALNLAVKEGNIAEIVEKFMFLKNKLVKRGAGDGFNLGAATLILERIVSGFDNGADRFMKVLDVMKANGWSTSTSNYPMAAILATMSGAIEDDLLFLKENIEMVKKAGFRRPNYVSAIIVAGAANELNDRNYRSGNSRDLFADRSSKMDTERSVSEIKDFDSFERELLEWMVIGLFDQ